MRVDELKKKLGDRIAVTTRSFMLRPEGTGMDFEQFVAYTNSWQRPAETEPRTQFTTPWKSDAGPPSGSLPAQVGWRAASLFGPEAEADMYHALLRAYFTDNRDISDWNELVAIAGEIGLDERLYLSRLDESKEHLASWVIEEHNGAIQAGINAVPTLVIGDVLPVPGAQDVETYERLISRYEQARKEAVEQES